MRRVLLALIGLVLIILLIYLIWRILPRNAPPVAQDDNFTTAYETAVSGSVSENDSDPDGDPLSFQSTLPQEPANGTATLDSTGALIYTPNAAFSGEDQLTYEVCDPDDDCATANVTITVGEPPVVVANDDTAETMLNTAVSVDVATNDQGENLSVQNLDTGPANGTAVIEANLVLYTPNESYVGGDSFTYTICNPASVCDSAQVNVTIRDFQVNDDQYNTAKNSTLADNVKNNDSGESTVTTEPVSAPTSGTLTLQATGEFTYAPNTDFVGEDSFSYEACNASAMCATAIVSIKVGGPVLGADNVQTTVNKPVSGNVSANDSGDNLAVNQTPVNAPASGGLVLLGDGNFTYTPNTDFAGSDTFTYEACDGDGLCAQAVVSIEVQSIPDSATHTVVEGEWLLQIARCYGTTVQAIRNYNYIYYPDYIYPGQKLFIPNIGSAGPYFGPTCVNYHKVEAGETLESIAATYNISQSELARINGLYTCNYYYTYNYYYGYYYHCYYLKDIFPGQILILPKPVPDYMRPAS